jgi:hypothetical protein
MSAERFDVACNCNGRGPPLPGADKEDARAAVFAPPDADPPTPSALRLQGGSAAIGV